MHKILFAGFCIFSFCIGFFSFWTYGVRVGVHPREWGTQGARSSLRFVLDSCRGQDRQRVIGCVEKMVPIYVRRWGLSKLMLALTQEQGEAPEGDIARIHCHDVGHELAQSAVKLAIPLATVFSSCTNVCQSGCFHGAISQTIATDGVNVLSDLPHLCASTAKNSDEQISCLHGVGHAIVDIVGFHVSVALSYCDSFAFFERQHCASGVFMELDTLAQAQNISNTLICSRLAVPYDEVCFARRGMAAYEQTHDISSAINACRTNPTSYVVDCLLYTGKFLYFAYPITDKNDALIAQYCRTYLGTLYDQCVSEIRYNAP